MLSYGSAQVAGDGNCQFRVLSDQLFGTDDQHAYIRSQVVERLRQFPEEYEPYVLGPYREYVDNMACDGTWGDHITLQVSVLPRCFNVLHTEISKAEAALAFLSNSRLSHN
jgi:OTU-like cysteine protease